MQLLMSCSDTKQLKISRPGSGRKLVLAWSSAGSQIVFRFPPSELIKGDHPNVPNTISERSEKISPARKRALQ